MIGYTSSLTSLLYLYVILTYLLLNLVEYIQNCTIYSQVRLNRLNRIICPYPILERD